MSSSVDHNAAPGNAGLPASVSAVVLAGGQGQRMDGQDKGFVELGGRPMIAYVLQSLTSQVTRIFISANRNHSRYAALGHSVVADQFPGFPGPLAGIAAGMTACDTPLLVTAPCDAPFVATDLVARLAEQRAVTGADIAVAVADGRWQPVFALIPVALRPSLARYLLAGERRIAGWYRQHRCVEVPFPAATCVNVNTPDDRAAAELVLAAN